MSARFGRAVARRARVTAAMLLLLPALALPALSATALAHAIVVESSPAPGAVLEQSPQRAVLRFNGKIERRLSRVTLSRGDGAPLPLPAAFPADAPGPLDRLVIPLPALGAGAYVLRYRVLSADGHITDGVLRFTVKAAP